MPRYFPSVRPLPVRPTTRRMVPRRRSEPAAEPHPKIILDHITQVSQNARATWFSLLGLLAFVGVTLLGHKDADFFAYGAETQLPLVGITVPVKAFFYVAPVLVSALYAYLHLYLMTLWDSLADAPAEIDGQPLADRVFPWLISYTALWERNRKRRDGSAKPRALGYLVTAVSLLLGWIFGIVVIFALWLRSMPAHEEWLTLWIGLWLWFATVIGLTGIAIAAKRMAGVSRTEVASAHRLRRRCAAGLAVILGFLSWETTEGGLIPYPTGTSPPLLYPAYLVLAELTRKPSGWLPMHLWMEDFEETFRRREGIEPRSVLTGEEEASFQKDAAERYSEYISQLDAPDLRRADLRKAKMSSTFLPGANLRKAKMQGANLRNAKMQGVNLFRADLQGATLLRAKMQGADLRNTMMQGADLRQAMLQNAQLDGAILQGATLDKAILQNANCENASFGAARLNFANVTCRNLTQAQMDGAVGNSQTQLPRALTVVSCLENLPADIEAVLMKHPENGNRFRDPRRKVRAALLCTAGKSPITISTPALN